MFDEFAVVHWEWVENLHHDLKGDKIALLGDHNDSLSVWSREEPVEPIFIDL